MQLYALNSDQQPVFAGVSEKRLNYFCPECHSTVRVRKGLRRQPHFYHLAISSSCNQSGKSLIHLQVQKFFFQSLPDGECALEMRFPEINRIADVVWHSKKMIFEIQCSLIASEEIAARNADYAQLGYTVVWILHEDLFNRQNLTIGELFLLSSKSVFYFTNINVHGEGVVYDQLDCIRELRRRVKYDWFAIQVNGPVNMPELKAGLPRMIEDRMKRWPIYFIGDAIHTCLESEEYAEKVVHLEKEHEPEQLIGWRKLLFSYIVRPYFLVLQMLLERASR